MQVITQTQLHALSQSGYWEDNWETLVGHGIPVGGAMHCSGCERVFGLTTAHFKSLEEAANILVLLSDVSADWLYAFMQWNNTVSHVPLSNKGDISTMTDGTPSTDTHSQLHQLQVQKLLQHEGRVVCLKGLNGELEALQFTFPELPLWDAAAPSESFWELQLLGGPQ